MKKLIIVTIVLFYFAASTEEEFGSVEEIKREIGWGQVYVVQTGDEDIFDCKERQKYGKIEHLNRAKTGIVISPMKVHYYEYCKDVTLTFDEFQANKFKKFKAHENAPTQWEITSYLGDNVGKGYEVMAYIEKENKYYSAVIIEPNGSLTAGDFTLSIPDFPEIQKRDGASRSYYYLLTYYRIRKKSEKELQQKKTEENDKEINAKANENKNNDEGKSFSLIIVIFTLIIIILLMIIAYFACTYCCQDIQVSEDFDYDEEDAHLPYEPKANEFQQNHKDHPNSTHDLFTDHTTENHSIKNTSTLMF